MFKCHLKNFITGGEGFGQRVVWQNSGKKSLQVAGLIGRPHQDLSPPKGFWRSSHSSQLFNGDFWGCFFFGIFGHRIRFEGQKSRKGVTIGFGNPFIYIRISLAKRSWFLCSKNTRTTSWVENENNQLIIRGPVWLAIPMLNSIKKSPSKFHKDKKSRYNYMRTQKETLWTCAKRIEIKKTKKTFHKKKKQEISLATKPLDYFHHSF